MSNSEGVAHTPRFVKSYKDRHGRVRCYYRRRGYPVVPLQGEPGSAAFAASYDLASERGIQRIRRRSPPGFVYFVRVRGFDLVKIGYSTSPTRRHRELENGSGMTGGLDLLGQFPATAPHERSLHRRFAKQHLFGEWFRLEGPIAAWIAEMEARAEAA